MELQTILVIVALALGIGVLLAYTIAFILSPNWRRRLEQPKHTMLDTQKRLWPKR
jgi:hypothetical protein